MAVQKRKTSRGETLEYHYKFMSGGKFYYGVCEGCSTKKTAEEYEAGIKSQAKALAQQKSVRALVENFREELTGGCQIRLVDAYELSLKKPRRRQPASRLVDAKRSYWNDFVAFLSRESPDVSNLSEVRKCHAEAYIQHLREHGRYDKQVSYIIGKTATTYSLKGNLSPKSVNTFHQTLTEVFEKLKHDAGLIDNPFRDIPKLNNASESREAFSMEELALIRDNLTPFTRPIFLIGIATALREGDICTLRWDEVNLQHDIITRKMLKTGATVEIPIMPPLKIFLEEQRQLSGGSEYVLPEHAVMYQSNASGISYRVKDFLEGLGLKTTKTIPGRGRAISVKDVHSLRHTFCYYAGIYGIPLVIVQSIVGHMTSEMTKHYQAHADRQTKREKMKLMPDFMGIATVPQLTAVLAESERLQLLELIKTADMRKVKDCLKILHS